MLRRAECEGNHHLYAIPRIKVRQTLSSLSLCICMLRSSESNWLFIAFRRNCGSPYFGRCLLPYVTAFRREIRGQSRSKLREACLPSTCCEVTNGCNISCLIFTLRAGINVWKSHFLKYTTSLHVVCARGSGSVPFRIWNWMVLAVTHAIIINYTLFRLRTVGCFTERINVAEDSILEYDTVSVGTRISTFRWILLSSYSKFDRSQKDRYSDYLLTRRHIPEETAELHRWASKLAWVLLLKSNSLVEWGSNLLSLIVMCFVVFLSLQAEGFVLRFLFKTLWRSKKCLSESGGQKAKARCICFECRLCSCQL